MVANNHAATAVPFHAESFGSDSASSKVQGILKYAWQTSGHTMAGTANFRTWERHDGATDIVHATSGPLQSCFRRLKYVEKYVKIAKRC